MFSKVKFSLFIFLFSFNVFADLQNDAVEALVNQNYNRAVPLLQKLALQGNPDAQYNLAILYKQGLGVAADSVKSNNYFSDSGRQGLVDGYRTISVSSVQPSSVQPILQVDKVLEPQAWVKDQKATFYTLQLASSTNARLIQKYFEENGLQGKAGYYKNRREGEDWYALVYGAYPSVSAANQAISSLPRDLRKWSPWVRKIGSIQRIMTD